jgi:hypothetical protein
MTTSSGGESFLIWGIDSLDCPGYIETTDVLTFGSTSDGTKLVSLTVPGGESEASLDVCFGTDGETTFVDKNGNHVTVGLLPDCSAVDGVPPCVVSRQQNEDYSITVTFIVPDGDPKGRL